MLQQPNNYYIRQLKDGNRVVFNEIYHEYQHSLYLLALRYLKKESLAQDALQEVFLKLWNHRADLDESRMLKGFLFTAMKHHLLNAIRKHKNEILKHTIYMQRQHLVENETENTINYLQSKELVDEGMGLLSSKKKEILSMSLYEGLSNQEIAEKLNISEHTVRSQLSQSNRLLRNFLNKAISTCLLMLFFI